jgi:transcriptional regulator with XRE-family HTH domain
MSIKKINTIDNFPNRLESLIKSTNSKKNRLAENIGLTPQAITQMTKGKSKPSPQTLKSLAREFDVSEQWLETGEGPMLINNDLILRRLLVALDSVPLLPVKQRSLIISKKIDYPLVMVEEMLNGVIWISRQFITKTCEALNLSTEWVLTGNTTRTLETGLENNQEEIDKLIREMESDEASLNSNSRFYPRRDPRAGSDQGVFDEVIRKNARYCTDLSEDKDPELAAASEKMSGLDRRHVADIREVFTRLVAAPRSVTSEVLAMLIKKEESADITLSAPRKSVTYQSPRAKRQKQAIDDAIKNKKLEETNRKRIAEHEEKKKKSAA